MILPRFTRFTLSVTGFLAVIGSASHGAGGESVSDPLAPWRSKVSIKMAAPGEGRHTIHSYFNTCPESPDGKSVLFFSSTTADGHHGDVVVRDRNSSAE